MRRLLITIQFTQFHKMDNLGNLYNSIGFTCNVTFGMTDAFYCGYNIDVDKFPLYLMIIQLNIKPDHYSKTIKMIYY